MSKDLTQTFGPPAKSLSGLLPPRTPAPREQPPPAADTTTEEPTPPPADDRPRRPADATPADPGPPADPPAPAPRRRTSSPRRTPTASVAPAEAHQAPSYQISVYVLPEIKDAAAQRRTDENKTNAEIAFDAIDAVQHRLTGLIRERRTQPRPESSLFPARARRSRPGPSSTAPTEGRRVLWAFRATSPELEVIDRLVKTNGAESRSELVAVALEAALLRRR
jgi:hypothetical protein